MIENRHLQADADIFAYECCDYNEPLQKNIDVLDLYIEQQRLLAGAGYINLHLTMGSKAGRYERATVKEYQANRKNRDPLQQKRVWELRAYMATLPNAQAWTDREADDGMAQFQVARIETHGLDSTVIMTKDKDLRMVSGFHIHPDTLEINQAIGFGSCYLDESTSSKQVKGWGTSFFWHQMLMGDTADNIPGLPGLTPELANRYKPTKKFNPSRRPLACGAVTAYLVLDGVTSDMVAMQRVFECYTAWYGMDVVDMTKWDDTIFKGNAVSMFFEQAHLLWMQRTKDEDFRVFLEEIKNESNV